MAVGHRQQAPVRGPHPYPSEDAKRSVAALLERHDGAPKPPTATEGALDGRRKGAREGRVAPSLTLTSET